MKSAMLVFPWMVVAAACGACGGGEGASAEPPAPAPAPALPSCREDAGCVALRPEDPEDRVQAAFATAKPGTRIELAAGRFKLTNTLAITTSNLTVRGAGRDATVLDFSGQKAGSEGIFAESVKSLVLEAFSVVDTRGNGIKTLGVDRLVMRKLAVSWSGADASAHGPYGLYPVQSKNVLVEECLVTGASDSGIYLGQSDGAVLRRNEVHHNVAGIEVENTFATDVYENLAHDNTGGILVFDLPGLPQKGGHAVRVHHNEVATNNTENFAPPGNIVGLVPRGTGILVMANADVEISDNKIRDNTTFGVAIASYFVTQKKIEDAAYYPFPARVHVHDNTFSGGGDAPDPKSELGALLSFGIFAFPNSRVPAITYDGVTDPAKGTGANPQEICLRSNGGAGFANLHIDKIDPSSPNLPKAVTLDAAPHDCALPPVGAPVIAEP